MSDNINPNAETSASYSGLGTLKAGSFQATLINVDGTRKFNISSLVNNVSIYEDIFSTTVWGVISITDGVNLMNGFNGFVDGTTSKSFPIVGEEFIEIQYQVNGFDSVFRRFAVNSIKNIVINAARTSRDYVIEFCSEEHLIDATSLVQKSFKNEPISDMVQKIAVDYLKIDKELPNGKRKKNIDIQPTRGQQNIVIPRLTPLETMNFLARRSIADIAFESGTYVFFENKDGFNFCDIEYLIRRGKKKIYKARESNNKDEINRYDYTYDNPSLVKPTSGTNEDSKFKNIISLTQKHKFDTIEKLKRGYFESEVLVYDFLLRKATPYTFKFADKYTNFNTLGAAGESVSEPSYPENSLDFIKSVTQDPETPATKLLGIFDLKKDDPPGKHSKVFLIAKDSLQPDTFLEEIYANRNSYMTRLAQNMFTCDVYGDPSLTAGDVITINLPDIMGTSESTKSQNTDYFLSGYFMISAIHHKLNPESYACTYDLFKNGFSSPVITTDNTETPDGASSAYLNQAAELKVKGQ